MNRFRKIAYGLAGLFATAGIAAIAADMEFSTGDEFSPEGFALFQGVDLNVIVDRVNALSDGTFPLTGSISVTGSVTASTNVTATAGDVTAGDDLISTDDLNVGGLATVAETLAVTGITTPTGGVASSGGFTASCRNVSVAGTAAQLAADGNDSTPVNTEVYISEIFVPYNCTATGVAVFNGSNVTDNIKVGIGSTAGVVLATSASTAGSGTDAYQLVPFTGTLALKGPATYYVLTIYAGNTSRYNTFAVGSFGCSKQTGQVFATGFTTFTAPTTFTTALCNIASLY